jgi:hypothetical protein
MLKFFSIFFSCLISLPLLCIQKNSLLRKKIQKSTTHLLKHFISQSGKMSPTLQQQTLTLCYDNRVLKWLDNPPSDPSAFLYRIAPLIAEKQIKENGLYKFHTTKYGYKHPCYVSLGQILYPNKSTKPVVMTLSFNDGIICYHAGIEGLEKNEGIENYFKTSYWELIRKNFIQKLPPTPPKQWQLKNIPYTLLEDDENHVKIDLPIQKKSYIITVYKIKRSP